MKPNLAKLKVEKYNSTTIAGDFNTPLPIINRTTRQKISKKTDDLNIIGQLDKKYIYRNTLPNKSRIYILINAHETFSRTCHIRQKTSLKFKRFEII